MEKYWYYNIPVVKGDIKFYLEIVTRIINKKIIFVELD